MPKRKDLNELAAYVVRIATEGRPEKDAFVEDSAAVKRGRLGGKVGGKARAAALSKKRRSEIAKKAARVRWSKSKKKGA